MKINTNVTRKHYNDCWCTAISKAMNVDYDKIRKDFKMFIADNGGANINVISAYLKNKGYEVINVDLDLKTALFLYNTLPISKTIFSLSVDEEHNGHIIHVENGVIYDDIKDFEYDEYINQYKVHMVFVNKQ